MNVISKFDKASPETVALIYRKWANSYTFSLINRVRNLIVREQKAVAAAQTDPNGAMGEYAKLKDENQDDNKTNTVAGGDTQLTLDLLVEFTAAVRATAFTLAEGFEGPERRYSQPMPIKDCVEFLSIPQTKVGPDAVEVGLELLPDLSKAEIIAMIQKQAIDDAAIMKKYEHEIVARVTELLKDAPADREFDTIVANLPEAHRDTLSDKAVAALESEIARLAPLVMRGVPGLAGKRRILRADLAVIDALVTA